MDRSGHLSLSLSLFFLVIPSISHERRGDAPFPVAVPFDWTRRNIFLKETTTF